MKKVQKLTAAAIFAASAALTATAPASAMQACNGAPFSGEYIVQPVPSFAPLTKENFNQAAGEQIVADVKHGSFLLVTPVNPQEDCREFMDKMKRTGLVQSIDPNYRVGIPTPFR